MPDLAHELSIVERGDVLVISGYPDDSESEWHVNSSEHISKGSKRRVAIILQAAGAGDHWLTIALEREDEGGEWEVDDLAVFEGKLPTGGDESAKSIDSDEIALVSIR